MSRTRNNKDVTFIPYVYNENPFVLLIDADSIVYLAHYGSEDDIEYSKAKINEKFMEISLQVEQRFNIISTMIFIKGKNNIRYKINKNYKKNRPEKHPNINLLYKYLKNNYEVIEGHDLEADDYLFSAWHLAKENSIIASIDKDLKSNCHGHFYDYRKNVFSFVTEKEQRLNFAIQMLAGDSTDNIKGVPGVGPKKALKFIHSEMSNFQYIKNIFLVYKKTFGENAKKEMKETFNLVNLHNIQNINNLKSIYGRRKESV